MREHSTTTGVHPGTGGDRHSAESQPASQRTVDTIVRLLTDHRRRVVLYYLRERSDETVSVPELLVWCSSTFEHEAISSDALRVELVHHQLPMLDDVGVVNWDRRRGTIRYVRNPLLERLLEAVRPLDDVYPLA